MKENRTDKNKNPISVKVTKKVSTTCTVKELICKANSQLNDFLRHVYTAHHQFRHITEVKRTLHRNEAVILLDFSENFECKLNAEVQSAHFGASKNNFRYTQVLCIHAIQIQSQAQLVLCYSQFAHHSAPFRTATDTMPVQYGPICNQY